MRKASIVVIVLTFVLMFPSPVNNGFEEMQPLMLDTSSQYNILTDSEVGGFGDSFSTSIFLSKDVSAQQVNILNTYADTATHTGSVDLIPHLIPGWHLYQADITMNSLTAIAEKKVVGVTYENYNFAVLEFMGTFYSQLAQGFYNQPYNGSLQNYSIYYSTTNYDSANRGDAFFTINSNYMTLSNMTNRVNMTEHDSSYSWEVVPGEGADLDANTVYWAILNGSLLKKYGSPVPVYPDIYWGSQNDAGSFGSYQKGTSAWDLKILEALFRYSYIAWNRTGGTPLEFSSPEDISLTANSQAQTGLLWTFTSDLTNLTTITLGTNLSVNLDYEMTLWYKKFASSATTWSIVDSGGLVDWNASIDLTFPVVSGITGRFMNITGVPSDWSSVQLYESGVPAGSFSKTGTTVFCSGLNDGDWIFRSSAPNYVVDIALADSFDSSPIGSKVSLQVDIEIDAIIEDNLSTPITGGLANLTVVQSSSIIFAPAEIGASGGVVSFLWDISGTTSGNGTYYIEVYWTNGLEAGYLIREVFVFYPTTLVADEYTISAFTDNSFNIGVDFDQVFPVRGLDDALADVMYTFNSTVNATLTNPSGGRWEQIIDTTGMSSGIYPLIVYAEGYAIENQSLVIYVELVAETQSLNWSWSPSNNITYLDSTNLTISYWDLNNANISGATVNVTFDGTTYGMHWDSANEVYWIQLNGTDFSVVPGTTFLAVSAWKSGYQPQYNDSISITVNPEAGVIFSVDWNPADLNITYIEQITIAVTYTYNSIPIDDTWEGVWVRATFSGHPLQNFTYNSGLGVWELTLSGRNYLGITTVTVRASATGYSLVQEIQLLTVVEDIPTLTSSWIGDTSSTDYDTDRPLSITVRDSSGAFIDDATVTLYAFNTSFPMVFVGDGVYSIVIDPVQVKGLHSINVTMENFGFRTSYMILELTISATTEIDVNVLSSEYERWNLTITVTYTDSYYNTPIEGATVVIILDGIDYTLQYSDGVYTTEIVLDVSPGEHTISVTANAQFCNEATASPSLTILAKKAVYLSIRTEGDPSAQGQVLSIIATLRYNESDFPVTNVNVYFVVTVFYANGTIEMHDSLAQFDTTNTEGVASWGFEIPSGTIENIRVEAFFNGDRDKWGTHLTQFVAVTVNPILLVLSFFFMTNIGRLIVISIVILAVIATGYNKSIKPKKRAARSSLENQLQIFRDLETLRHFMAIYLDRGTCVFYHPFTEERIQPDLISGFIAAITSVYGEIKGDGVRGTLEEIQYHGLRLNSYSGEFIIGILILEGEMTPLLRERLQFFVELFENQYDQNLKGWTGLIDCFDPEWVVSTLNSSFNYSWLLPHRFGPTQKVSKNIARILDYIGAIRDERGEFYLKDLLKPLAEMFEKSEAEILDRLLHLQDRSLIVSVSIQTIIQRQGMGLATDKSEGLTIPVPPELMEEIEKTSEEAKPEEPKIVEKTKPKEEKRKAPKKFVDPLEEFVQDVEELLRKEKEEQE